MFEIFEQLEGYFDNWYSKGFLLLAVIIGVLMLGYYIVRLFL